MIDHIVSNFESFADIYTKCLVVAYIVGIAFLCAVWLKPFVRNLKAAYLTAVIYCLSRLFYYAIPIDNDFMRALSLGIILITFLSSWLLDQKRNPVQKLFLCILYYLMSWLTYEISVEIGLFENEFISKFEWYHSDANAIAVSFIIWNLVEYGFAVLIMYASIRLNQKAYKRKMEELSWKELWMLLTPFWTILLVKPIMLAYFTLWMDGIANGSIKENIPASLYRLTFCILSLLSIVIILSLYQRIKESKEDEFAKQALKSQTEDIRRHMGQIEEMYEKIRAMRHDMGNHMAVIEGLVDNDDKDSLHEYIGQWKKHYNEAATPVKTGNPIIDVAISEFAARFQEAGIPFEQSFRYPEQLQIDPFDLCIVVTNALQNAYEASLNTKQPLVSLTSVIHDQAFIMSLKNHVDRKADIDPEEEMPVSSKTEDGHGYGLKNIRTIAGKYKGDFEIRQESEADGYIFVLNVMFIG